jgi:outer membrane protein TolC
MKRIILLNLILTLPQISLAENLTFSKVWSQINAESKAVQASHLQLDSLNESKARAQRHWLPRIYLGAQTYQTNDPGASFFGLLSQRSLLQSDFAPDLINHPDTKTYTKGTLGVDLPLYEGGMKSSQVDLYNNLAKAQEHSTNQVQLEQFSQVALSYASIAILNEQKNKISDLSVQIEKLLKNYQLGNRSNPVGYSGLLGMKSVQNRLTGLKQQYDAQIKAYYAMFKEYGLKDENWSPVMATSVEFVEKYLVGNKSTSASENSSYKVQSMKSNTQASEEAAQMERARFLPRVGAFAETQAFKSDRDTADSYIAGLYLQWNLFDAASFGILKEARLKADSTRKFSEALDQQERAEKLALTESLKAYQQNIQLLNDSYKLLIEQTKMTETLFKNGSINALQFVEVLSRRADLITQQGDAEIGLVKAATQMITKQNFNVEIKD